MNEKSEKAWLDTTQRFRKNKGEDEFDQYIVYGVTVNKNKELSLKTMYNSTNN